MVVEDSVAGANDGILGWRPGESDPGLQAAVVVVDVLCQTAFEVPAQTIIDGDFGSETPLVLDVEAEIAVVEVDVIILRDRRRRSARGLRRLG